MKAVALTHYLPISDPESLFDARLPKPSPTGRDLLVRVEAVSVNPVDTKVRAPKEKVEDTPKVLGYDAAGVVESVGDAVTRFKPGDAVYYAGDITRPGSNAEFQLVDERIVGAMPQTLSFAEAAALPLTTLTAWEALFTRLGINRAGGDSRSVREPTRNEYPYGNRGQSILIIGGAGGVGSIAIQLAKLAGLVVIATASRPQSQAWVRELGADHSVDYSDALIEEMAQLGHREVDFIANFSDTDAYWGVMAELIRPQGKIVGIVGNTDPLDLNLLKNKSATFAWEFMFTRSMYQTADMADQGHLLNEVAALIDAKTVRTTLGQTLSPINATNLRQAHAQIESGRTIGKLVLEGWR
ncbi:MULTISPECIES: zinc-binding alcohol dehydrogenase family protein [Cyanophyceae]|uniref:zinc-binding alcohol dehydrogenase family protein n=1 Tax=Cyanophyceae TaxID=3028117 RepID=UPI001683EC20|nr:MULTISPECIES: zinc-binding alcohol dehydrogenase family protein [Cyanophyceae]MBD1918999.1 zinc-binding alcohol dehydrogenase family protein [Phormidium sp. FACHB-77]MBD2031961.1 zinc-binding alcohol dehydrogenase family protein [Phormidium sp. FACHB-322]MBD2053924.1 zinc-binding alcohol dehydrogenase family protein [Leptolyngbya sp. FACHB-60]